MQATLASFGKWRKGERELIQVQKVDGNLGEKKLMDTSSNDKIFLFCYSLFRFGH